MQRSAVRRPPSAVLGPCFQNTQHISEHGTQQCNYAYYLKCMAWHGIVWMARTALILLLPLLLVFGLLSSAVSMNAVSHTKKTSFLRLENGHYLSYQKLDGDNNPGVVFLPGFRSSKNGKKALALEKWCREENRPFVRFDYRGHGESSGVDQFAELSVVDWIDDALLITEKLTKVPLSWLDLQWGYGLQPGWQ
jgi:hypothetical protein